MLSKKRAELRANELLRSARADRDQEAARTTQLLVVLFPELAAHAPVKRWSALREAHARAWAGKLLRVILVVELALAAAWTAAPLFGRERHLYLLLAIFAMVAIHLGVDYFETRRHLRSMRVAQAVTSVRAAR